MLKNSYTPINRQTAGYTIDQTILIVAIIAILVTLVIMTVGWNLLSRAGGAKLAAQLKQVEDAHGQFYSTYRMWPHETFTQAPNGILNLVPLFNGTGVSYLPTVDTTKLKNYLSGFRSSGVNLYHNFGDGNGTITAQVNSTANIGVSQASNKFIVIQFSGVPLAEAQEADEKIDGVANGGSGRFVYKNTACLNTTMNAAMAAVTAGDSSSVFVCYVGNAL